MSADDQLQGDAEQPDHYNIRTDERFYKYDDTGYDLDDAYDLHKYQGIERDQPLVQVVRPVCQQVSEFVEAGNDGYDPESEL